MGWRSNEVPTPWAANQSFGGRQWGGAAESLLLPPEVSQSQLLKKKKKKKKELKSHRASARCAFYQVAELAGMAVFPRGPVEALGTQS